MVWSLPNDNRFFPSSEKTKIDENDYSSNEFPSKVAITYSLVISYNCRSFLN